VVKGNDDEGTVSILYDGEIWQANTSDIYPVKDPLKGEVRFV
jgi:hypothetical protein